MVLLGCLLAEYDKFRMADGFLPHFSSYDEGGGRKIRTPPWWVIILSFAHEGPDRRAVPPVFLAGFLSAPAMQ